MTNCNSPSMPTRAFTLVELLVVLAIIALLFALILPAIGTARESSRRTTCANNLRQHATGVRLHEQAHQIFPTGGWKGFLGEPDAGYGTKQPGGWIYNILPFIEQDSLRQLGRGGIGSDREMAQSTLMQTPISIMYCPSRRLPRLYPFTGTQLKNAIAPETVAKSDYAISSEVSYEKSEVIVADIQLRGKGTSNTVLVGEKSLSSTAYNSGGAGDSMPAYVGDSNDISRNPDGRFENDKNAGGGFGGPHLGGVNIGYCDGSIRFISED